jgi:hypothetical protein
MSVAMQGDTPHRSSFRLKTDGRERGHAEPAEIGDGYKGLYGLR